MRAKLGLACVLAAAALAACSSGPPPVLPPIPASAGLVMVKAGEAPAVPEGQTLIDRVVAMVNGEVVLLSELQEAVLLYQRETKGPTPTERETAELRKKMLDRLIDHRLQVQEARREKVEVTEEEVRAREDEVLRASGEARAEIEARLRAEGMTLERLRRDLKDQLLAQRIRSRRVGRRANVTEAEVDAYMTENRAKLTAGLKYRARHLVVLAEPPEQPAAWARAQAEIEALATRLRSGADFAAVARERSRDVSAAVGGDLGWLAVGELEAVFEEPLLELAKGGITAPIKSGAGYHLFQLEDREELSAEMLAEARQQARDLLGQRKAQERLDEWVEGLRRRALIAIRL